ncbi:MAG: DUF342 domain-containing protein [Bdellovibrionota bacterium]|jgi:uncharacterized protein (DUF342 family)
MTKPTFEVRDEQFHLKAFAEEQETKLFIDVERFTTIENVSIPQLESMLLEHIDERFIDYAVLSDVVRGLKEHTLIEQRRVAKGVLPKKGANGRIVYLKRRLSKDPYREPSEAQDVEISMRDLRLFENIHAGEAVARIYHPKEGLPGMSVFGKELLAAPGDPVKVTLEKGSLIQESGEKEGLSYDRIIAQVDGYLEVQGSRLAIKEEFVVPGNLNAEFGSIDFIGSVHIKGDVLAGYGISADKGIKIGGSVNRTELRSQNGPIEIAGRFFGEGSGRIVSGHNVTVKSIQSATVDARGDVFIKEEARNATIRTRSTLQAPTAHILGGKCFVVAGALVGEFGSTEEIPTDILLGSDTEVSEEYQVLLLRIDEHEKGLELIQAHLGPYANNPARVALLAPHLRPKLEKLLTKRERVQRSLEALNEKKDLMLEEATPEQRGILSIHRFFHPRGRVIVGDCEFEVDESVKGPASICFEPEKEEFYIKEFEEITPAFREEEIDDEQSK